MGNTEPKTLRTMRTYKDGGVVVGESEETQDIDVRLAPEGVALGHISYGNKFTKNLLNYESVSIDVRLTLPTTLEESHEAYKTAKTFVEEKILAEYNELKEAYPAAFKTGI